MGKQSANSSLNNTYDYPCHTPNLHPQPSPNAEKLELLRQHFPGAIDTDAQGRMRINANALQLAIGPRMAVEEDGYELRWWASARRTTAPLCRHKKSCNRCWPTARIGTLPITCWIKGDNLDALRACCGKTIFGQSN